MISRVSARGAFANGCGVAQDDAEAVRWYRKAADQGHALGQNGLGVMYLRGHGVAQDDAEAVRWFRRAAEQGEVGAQSNLGFMYQLGHGVALDYSAAYMWFSVAGDDTHANRLAKGMSTEEIAEAQRLAREWDAVHPR